MDNPEIVDIGLCQMLSLVVDHDLDAELDVFSSVSIEFWCFYQWFSVYQVKALFFLGGGGVFFSNQREEKLEDGPEVTKAEIIQLIPNF